MLRFTSTHSTTNPPSLSSRVYEILIKTKLSENCTFRNFDKTTPVCTSKLGYIFFQKTAVMFFRWNGIKRRLPIDCGEMRNVLFMISNFLEYETLWKRSCRTLGYMDYVSDGAFFIEKVIQGHTFNWCLPYVAKARRRCGLMLIRCKTICKAWGLELELRSGSKEGSLNHTVTYTNF